METVQDAVLSEKVVVDRSPELMRGERPTGIGSWFGFLHGGPLFVKVTRDIIDRANRGDGATCAFALAWKEARPDDEPHFEGEKPYVILDNGTRMNICMHENMVDWIGRFDRGEPVDEIEFLLS